MNIKLDFLSPCRGCWTWLRITFWHARRHQSVWLFTALFFPFFICSSVDNEWACPPRTKGKGAPVLFLANSRCASHGSAHKLKTNHLQKKRKKKCRLLLCKCTLHRSSSSNNIRIYFVFFFFSSYHSFPVSFRFPLFASHNRKTNNVTHTQRIGFAFESFFSVSCHSPH